MDYQVIGSFAIQDETANAILEGLQKLKEWNPEWSPKVMLVDYCEEEIQALQTLFPGTLELTLRESYFLLLFDDLLFN